METPSNQWCLTPKQEESRIMTSATLNFEFLHAEGRGGVTSVENESHSPNRRCVAPNSAPAAQVRESWPTPRFADKPPGHYFQAFDKIRLLINSNSTVV